MVSTVLSRYLEETRLSNIGIGHVRYSTHGGNRIENAQPMLVNCNKGRIALAHNGNISNTHSIKTKLENEGSIFQSTSDSELILHLIARSRKSGFKDSLRETLNLVEGAFSIVLIHENTLIAVRDPRGFRPLYIGTKASLTVVASETCALDILQIRDYRSVAPGEMITVDGEGLKSERFASSSQISQCVFELVYFARPDSYVFDRSVHLMRKRMGAALAKCDTCKGDLVVPVPDSGNSAALGYAEASGIPFEQGLQRNHYAGRSFIMPTTAERELAVRMKLYPVRSVIQGKRVILVDDSLVRGTTSRTLIKLVREAGAVEIHLRLTSPELKFPCYFGIDIPTREELISNSKTAGEIAEYIGADSVTFLPIEQLRDCVENPNDYCFACFNGIYPINVRHGEEVSHK
jgi:amidophosphoribosyltransferase